MAPPSYRAVIFDLDGTLIDSLADIGEAMNCALQAHQQPTHPLEAYLAFVGEGVEKLTERSLPKDAVALRPLVMAEYRRTYAATSLTRTVLYPGIAALLDALIERGMKLAVLSNKPQAPTESLCQALLPRWPLQAVFGERPGVPRKPHPGAALEISRSLGVEPRDCLFVGDTGIDMGTAVAAGMTPVGVLWGFRGRTELTGAGARHVLEEPSELLQLLG